VVTLRRLRVPTAAAAIVAALVVPPRAAEASTPSPAAQRAGASVTVADMAFSPASVTVEVGASVTWTFQDSISHTTTSDQGFWDSGTRSGGATYARRFTTAGTFAYHCTIHSMMHGKVRVPVTATGSPSAGWRLRWATRKGSGGSTFVVQTRLGKGRWTALVSGARTPGKRFDPARAGTYSVRARTVKGAERSGWSPTVRVTIS
jgi:plastocyanin